MIATQQDLEETPKQLRMQDSETFGKNTAVKNLNGASCESVDRENKSVSSSNMDLAFNKKKSNLSNKLVIASESLSHKDRRTVSSKKSRKDLITIGSKTKNQIE